MKYWDTGDRVVDSILQKMEGFSNWRADSNAESTHQLLSGLINIQEMLPKAVSKHFDLPYLYVGNSHFSGSQDYRSDLISKTTDALKTGLKAAGEDSTLKRDSEPDFSDRPRSRGEEILDALAQFERDRDRRALSRLQMAVSPTRLQSRVKTIEMLMSRKRPYGNQSPELAMLGELHRLEFEAQGYHGQKM
jgi:hypothetical protein